MENYLIRHSKLLFWLSFAGTNLALFTPSVGPRGEIYNLDIIIHYSMFLGLAFSALLYRAAPPRRGGAALVLVVLLLFVVLSEFIQENFIPGRGYEFSDILSGVAGLLSGFMVYKRLWQSK